jgi:protein-S-isoprenylcysteine O-methyltransferase Ste14
MSSRVGAAAGSLLFLVVVPGTVAGLVPWVISGWRPDPTWPVLLRALGLILITAGLLGLLAAFAQFVWEGRGTPAPVAPTEQLVVHGLYRHVRNPMYLAVAAVIFGQALALPSVGIAGWGAVFAAAVIGFVRLYEEPTLQARYGDQYDSYRSQVRRWWPRLTPYRG